jgi:hypothetical protein
MANGNLLGFTRGKNYLENFLEFRLAAEEGTGCLLEVGSAHGE